MSKKSIILSPLKRPSTRSLSSTTKPSPQQDKYTFQSDDENHNTKPTLLRKTNTPVIAKRQKIGRPPKTLNLKKFQHVHRHHHRIAKSTIKNVQQNVHTKSQLRRASRLGSQTNTPVNQIREKIKINSTPPILITPRKTWSKT